MERRSICFPQEGTQNVLQCGDQDFQQELTRLYSVPESNALEILVALKARLRRTPTDAFWTAATEGMAEILGAEMTFVIKRVLVDDQCAAVEMPPLGEPGSCMLAAAFHYCGRDGTKETFKQSKFHAWGCPCSYMRNDKVFLIPERLPELIKNNPNKLPTPAEAYIAVPLSAEGKCFAHFGAMWSKEGAAQRSLSWAFIEALLHSLEDMILERLLEGSNFIRPSPAPRGEQRVIPHDAITLAQSLRPYAPSLSHELRTPMQGVVGMLDVMYATVQEAVDTQSDPQLRKVFESLKESIEVVQDSSRRAVEAADNFVHAADMDLTVPDAPLLPQDDSMDSMSPFATSAADRRPEILVAGSNLPLSRPNKRRRDEAFSRSGGSVGASKMARVEGAAHEWSLASDHSHDRVDGLRAAEGRHEHARPGATAVSARSVEDLEPIVGVAETLGNRLIAPGLRHTNMREVFQYVINEGLKMGGRPDSAIASETENGEVIEVRSRGSDGTASSKIIEWSVDRSVPQTMFVDEKDLTKLISCLFLNAIKFTDSIEGRVRCSAKMSQRGRYISIRVSDNGPGIPADFLPRLFHAFAQGDATISRAHEGLGLGLMVAKGIARKLGGDLNCIRAETEGPEHGSQFEIKVPVMAGETISRPPSPFRSPMPRGAQPTHHANTHTSHMPPAAPAKPHGHLDAAHDSTRDSPLNGNPSPPSPSTTPSPRSQPTLTVPAATAAHSTPSAPTPQDPPPPSEPKRPAPRSRKSISTPEIDRDLAAKHPLTFLVAEDNKINRKLLVSMLSKFGYRDVLEAHDGAEAVRQMAVNRRKLAAGEVGGTGIDVVLMDLWMPLMDGYEATERILGMERGVGRMPTVLAVTADVTDGALERAAQVGMRGFMTKPYKLMDLQKLILEYCARNHGESSGNKTGVKVDVPCC
ncbi:hypothetical protein LTR91_022737 [Friedmanniomyces endolithicus]|uniref:histidine kinase n=1 Tax=Friedmanniomyces endolithicus TaxID=329885 RepID=A0AAN6K444_9PEZI|nr:hypothetical protein LTR35_013465 [Friedmanniomyces endolithicus]KAK0280551.1 hypothetical protein LTS00_012980 [Friedmanniomyces endolithicus]KAK0955661.1 hypothetical protein LTR91_022737 [Friedmanniomyces endolithicus]KAK1049996.1 hypothetical protein LTS16_003452 [Friedmanniomyces endolithicus]